MKVLKTAYMSTVLILGLSAFSAQADDKMYSVTIKNLTPGQTFTPILVSAHSSGQSIFTLGEAASPELVAIAESGNTGPLQMKLSDMGSEPVSTGGLLGPGQSVSVTIMAKEDQDYLSLAGMMLPTNDGFIAVNGVKLKKSRTLMLPAYDAGSEMNDELCAHIPGPHCGGAALSVEDGEGFVHIHSGIHGQGDLLANQYDWRNPAVMVKIMRMK